MLIGATVLVGIAAAIQISYPLLVMEIVPNKYRGWGQGMITLLVLPSLGFGPIVGRTIVENVAGGWRFTYWVAAIVNGISLVFFVLFYFPPAFNDLSRKSRLRAVKEIDYVGFVLFVGPIICLLLALSMSLRTRLFICLKLTSSPAWGGSQYPWDSGRIIALLVVGCVGIVAFFLYEWLMPQPQPLLPLSLFKIRNYTIAVIVGSVAQMSYYALNIFWPLQASSLYTTNSVTVGWMSVSSQPLQI